METHAVAVEPTDAIKQFVAKPFGFFLTSFFPPALSLLASFASAIVVVRAPVNRAKTQTSDLGR